MKQFLRPLSVVLALTVVSGFGRDVAAQQIEVSEGLAEVQTTPGIADRIVEKVDDGDLTALKGSHLHLGRAMSDRGPVDGGLAMGDLFLVLRRAPEVQRAFDAFVASQYDASAANFHQWLTAEQIGERFGPSAGDVETVSAWLRSKGLRVDEVAKDRVYLRFSGTAEQVQAAFHTEVHALDVKGTRHVANVTDISVPAALAPVVAGVHGLSNFYPRPLHRLGQQVTRDADSGAWKRTAERQGPGLAGALAGSSRRPKPLFGTTDVYGDVIEDVVPYDFAAIYNVLPLWQQTSPIDGTGQTIAIVGTSNINLSDVAAFRTAFGLPTTAAANTPTVIVTNSDPGTCTTFADSCSSDLIENTLDVEWSGAVAKGASIVLVTSSAPTATTDAVALSENYIVQNKTATIMNVSYGECELLLADAGNMQYNNLWQTAAAEGISVFVATGDSGSPACDQGDDAVDGVPYGAQFGLSVSGVASTPYDTAVGGTDLNWGSAAAPYWGSTNSATTKANAAGYMPEVPWNSTCTNPLIFSTLAGDAMTVGATPVTDAESACNFVIENYASIETNYGVDLSGLVDTIGGGGGASNCTSGDGAYPMDCTAGYPKPSWQKGVSGIPADGVRDLPDVSFFASDGFLGSSYLICVTGAGACSYTATSEPVAQEVGGTSVASPAMAGIMALIDQKTGGAEGNANPTLYTLAAGQSYSACSTETAKASGACLFNDIDTGTIAMVCESGSLNCTTTVSSDPAGVLSGFAAGAGYDLATGLGSLNVTNVVNKWPLLSAPLVTLSPTSLAFPSTVEGYASATKAVTLTNSGKSALSITGITFTGTNASSFSQTNNCPASLAMGATCTITVTFKPVATGSLSASVSVADTAYDSPQAVALTGTATAPAPIAAFNAQSISFGSTAVGGTNTATVSLSNSGTAALAISSIGYTGANASSFTESDTCGSSLAAGATCTVTVNFKPLVAGSLTATLQAVDNAGNSPQTVALSGTATGGSSSLTITPSSMTFPSTTVGSSAATQTITISNSTGAAVTFSPTTITGSGASSFTRSNVNCTSPLANGSSCTNVITFTPQSAGTLTAAVTYTTSASNSPQTVSLTGTGASASTGLTITPGSLTFASTKVGSSAATQAITLKNNTSSAVTFTATTTITGAGASSFSRMNTNCASPLAAGASCTNVITFTPQTVGTLTATVNYFDSASSAAQAVTLSGTGASASTGLTITPGSLTFPSTAVGSSAATQTITLTNNTSAAVTFTATTTITGANASSFSRMNTNCASPLAAGASCMNVITFTPQTAGALTATVSYFDSAATSAQTVALGGTGTSASSGLTITPGSLMFPSTAVGSSAATQTITLTNNTTAAVTFTATTTITGAGASSFSRMNTNCASPLAAGASCMNVITFKPQSAGTLTATVSYYDSASSAAQTVALSGTGAGLTITPGTLSFASTTVGTSAATQTITLTNNTSAAVTFTGTTTITGAGASSFSRMNTNCVSPLAAGASCMNVITFTPQSAGALAATVSYFDSASSSAQTVTLSGTGK